MQLEIIQIKNRYVHTFLEESKTSQFAFEIYRPLIQYCKIKVNNEIPIWCFLAK